MVPSWCPQQPFFEFFPIWPLFPPKNDKNRFFFPPVHALINDPPPKSYRHQLGPMIHFLTTKKFDPLLYFQGSGAPNTFAKLPVHALINDPPKKSYRHQLGPMTHLFDNNKTWPTFIFLEFVLFGKSPKLPVHALNHDPQKKKLQAPTRGSWPPFLTQKNLTYFIISKVYTPQTHFQSFLCMS